MNSATSSNSERTGRREHVADWLCTHGALVRACSLVALVIGLALMVRVLPLQHALESVRAGVHSLGAWGPFAFGALSVLAGLSFGHGLLSVAAGAIFGLGFGTWIAWSAGLLSAAVGFFAARYVGRQRIERFARRHPEFEASEFEAIGRAVETGGWRIVALARISPLVPYSVANVAFGLTSMRFSSYWLASAVSMWPGAFLCAYVGYLGAQSFDDGARSVRWAWLGIGLAATVAGTSYASRVARRMFDRHAGRERAPRPARRARPVALLAACALLVLATGVYVTLARDSVRTWLGWFES